MTQISKKNAKDLIECVLSLREAFESSGGYLDFTRMGRMDVLEFLVLIAPNRIRFTHSTCKEEG